MVNKIVSIGTLLDKGLIKKSTKIKVNIEDLKKNNFIKNKLALVRIEDLKNMGMVK